MEPAQTATEDQQPTKLLGRNQKYLNQPASELFSGCRDEDQAEAARTQKKTVLRRAGKAARLWNGREILLRRRNRLNFVNDLIDLFHFFSAAAAEISASRKLVQWS